MFFFYRDNQKILVVSCKIEIKAIKSKGLAVMQLPSITEGVNVVGWYPIIVCDIQWSRNDTFYFGWYAYFNDYHREIGFGGVSLNSERGRLQSSLR